MSIYTYKSSSKEPDNLLQEEDKAFIIVNSLEEKRVNIYYKRGPLGTLNSQCGQTKLKLRKNKYNWFRIEENCPNHPSLVLFRIEPKN